jgi:hypothetical protein
MDKTYSLMLVGAMALVPVTRAATINVTTEAATGAGSLTTAINALHDGDTIAFHIPPETGELHYIQTPPDGYPLITNNNITIDGGTQGGATPNTAPINAANNAVLKIVLCSTNGNAASMYSAVTNAAGFDYPKLGFADDEQALLGFFKATNAWVKGLVFLSAYQTSSSYSAGGDSKTICFAPDAPDVSSNACQGFHVSGCWFGVDPVTRQVAYMPDGVNLATPTICIATYTTGTNGTPGFPNIENSSSGTVGVAAGSANPHAEFNVFFTGYGFDSQGGPFRISGNFWNVLPDGVTLADITALNDGAQTGDAYVEFGSGHDILIGTDGDGVNDADERNVFGSFANDVEDAAIEYYGSQGTTVIAGNTFGVDIHGNSFGVGQNTKLVHHFNHDSTCAVRFGSDFNGISDALEANTVADAILFDIDTASGGLGHWISMRGNFLTNTATPSISRPPLGDGQADFNGQQVYAQFIDISGGTMDIIPVIGAGTTTTTLTGTCGKRTARFIRVVLDLYEADTTTGVPPQGKKWLGSFAENSAADSNPAEGAFSFNIASLGIAHGTQVTLTATYIVDNLSISSVSRSGGNTTLNISGGAPPYDIYGSATVDGTYTLVSTSASATATFAAPASMSFYYVVYHPQITSGSGQTSPFSDLFTIP